MIDHLPPTRRPPADRHSRLRAGRTSANINMMTVDFSPVLDHEMISAYRG